MTYELTGKIKDISTNRITNETTLTLSINEMRNLTQCYDELHNVEKLLIVIDKYREKRSLNANKYMWSLCNQLAECLSDEKVKYTKDDIYRDKIKESGIWYDDEIEPEKVTRRCKAWQMIGTGWLTERVDFSADGNREIIRFYYGSSQYNKKQMARLIDNIVQDCEAVGIPTKTPDELANMLSLWEQERR